MRKLALAILLAPLVANAAIPLTVRDTVDVPRLEVVRSGVPLSRADNVRSVNELAIVDRDGNAVPAEFEVLARWNAGRADASAPVQWLLVTFPAISNRSYHLITDGSVVNPSYVSPLRLTQDGSRFTIDTNAATFVVEPQSLFGEIRRAGALLVRGGTLTVDDAAYASTRRAFVEHSDSRIAVIVIEGTYANGLATQRRYTFTAGSGTAIVRQTVAWEGDRCNSQGAIECGGAANGVRISRVRDTLDAVTADVKVRGARNTAMQSGTSLEQVLRSSRTAPPRYEIDGVAAGTKADGALLSAETANGTIVLALDHMHRYEPQALRALENGSLAIDLASDDVWLGSRQAMFATFAVAALPGLSSLDATVWAPLNHPLRAWPTAKQFASVIDVPVGPLPPELADYDRAVEQVLENTVAQTDAHGVFGLMTFGLYPRIWGNPIFSDEIDCFGNDPTPGESWDDLYWCATWTDYHNTSTAAAMRAMRTGEVEWLDEIAGPAALRQLYTQILQCSPDDGYFYCGQAPAGYGGYRADFNSSHAYFDNLYLYYWLTGDRTVVEVLERGSRSMRNYLCARRPASPCLPHDEPVDEWANLTGRVASQWIATFRFVGLASGDASYLDDYRNNLARAVTQQFLALGADGFLLGGWKPVTAPGTHTTDQLWMTGLYDTKNLAQLQRDTEDAPIGDPPLRPSEILLRLARTLDRYGGTTVDGDWPNSLDVTWTGSRVGGSVVRVMPTPGGGDPLLYDTGKAALAGFVARTAMQSADPALAALARDLTRLAIRASLADASPLGKLQGEYLARLHAAVASLAPPVTQVRRRAVRK